MKFKKYGSIEGSHRAKTVNHIIETGNADVEWVSTLKIHGANYSLWCDGVDVKRGKRSGFVEGESFYGDFNFDYSQNVREMYKYLYADFAIEYLSVHGEIYGGMYNHPDVKPVKGATKVQKEVSYRPDNDFIGFDLKADGMIVNHNIMVDIFNKFDIPIVPELGRGTFKEMMELPIAFSDPLHKRFGLPTIEDNDAEGWVIKTIVPLFFFNGSRIILKGKNPEFSEKNGGKKHGMPKPIYEMTEDGERLNEEMLTYINENRLRNVLSHGEIENITQKDFGRLLGLFSKDIFDDFMKDYSMAFDTLVKKEQNIIKKTMNREAGNVIRPNFVNIIDKEF